MKKGKNHRNVCPLIKIISKIWSFLIYFLKFKNAIYIVFVVTVKKALTNLVDAYLRATPRLALADMTQPDAMQILPDSN